MNIEFIIGTLLGIIGIIPILISVVRWMRKSDLSRLMEKLVDKEISRKEHQKILRVMNKRLLLSGYKKLGDEYINQFTLGKRGKEAVFEEMCLQNRIEPTPELCRMFLKADAPSIPRPPLPSRREVPKVRIATKLSICPNCYWKNTRPRVVN